ncbi:hypothetical protein [Achromobacter aloeverae]
MIRITNMDGRVHYLAPAAIARIVEAGANWHGIRSYVKTFDGKTIEASEDAATLAAAIEAAPVQGQVNE